MSVAVTSLRLPEELKERIEKLAEASGESVHALTLRFIAERVEDAERFQRLLTDADAAYEQLQRTGTGYDAREVFAYLEARLGGKHLPPKPKRVKWRA